MLGLWIWIQACQLRFWGLGLTGVDYDMTRDFSKDLFNIDMTQCDFLAIRPYHVIYGQPLNIQEILTGKLTKKFIKELKRKLKDSIKDEEPKREV